MEIKRTNSDYTTDRRIIEIYLNLSARVYLQKLTSGDKPTGLSVTTTLLDTYLKKQKLEMLLSGGDFK